MDDSSPENELGPNGASDNETENETPETTENTVNTPPAESESGFESSAEESSSSEPSPIAPPAPGEVISNEPSSSEVPPTEGVPPNQPVVGPGGGKKRWLAWVLILAIIAALAAGGWWYYQRQHSKSSQSNAASQSKDVPLLKIGFLQPDFGELYPNMSVNDYSFSVNDQIFEGLVRYENKSKIVPDLASKWSNPDANTWVFTIKDGVKFHDGHTLTANDVKTSLDNVLASKSDLASTFADTIASVSVVNGNKVKITTTDPDPTLLNKLTFLYVIDANLPKGDEPSLAGTGPYEVKPGTKPTNTGIQLVAFDGYHNGRPTTRALSFGSEKDSSALLKAFGAHKYNIVGYAPLKDAKNYPNAKHFTTIASDVDFIGFNTVKPGPLQNKLVREAIRYAVNAQDIGNVRGGQVTTLSQLIPPSIPGYNPAIKPYKQDTAKAKQLLAQAGYPNGLTLRYSTSSGGPEATAEIASELKKAGITLTIDSHPDFDEFIDYFSSGKAEMFSVDYSSDTLDGLDIYTTTLQSSNYNNPKLNAIFDQAATTVDPAKRLKLLQDAAVLIDQDIPVVPLSTEEDLWLMDQNYAITQDLPSSYMPVYIYKVHQ